MIRLLALAVFLLPRTAVALSCIPYGPGDAYVAAAEAEETYRVVLGRLDFDASLVPETWHDGQVWDRPAVRVPARVVGKALGDSRFTSPFDEKIEIIVECIGPWCPILAPGKRHLLFLELQGDIHVLRANTCVNNAFAEPSARDIRTVLDCHAGRDCETFGDR